MFTKVKVYERRKSNVTGKYMELIEIGEYSTNGYADLRDVCRNDEAILGAEHINVCENVWCINLGFMERFYVFN